MPDEIVLQLSYKDECLGYCLIVAWRPKDAPKDEDEAAVLLLDLTLSKKLKVRRIFDMIPSNLENKKKRVVIKDIEDKKWIAFKVPLTKGKSLSIDGLCHFRHSF